MKQKIIKEPFETLSITKEPKYDFGLKEKI